VYGDRRDEGRILNNLGALADNLGQKKQARDYYEQALAIYQDIGDVVHARIVASNLADLDVATTPSGEAPKTSETSEAPDAPLAVPPEKPLPPKRHWPWQRTPRQ
jgi:hypothetical protein